MKPLRQRIAALYARIPDVACKGLCSDYCGPIGASASEGAAMLRAASQPLTVELPLRAGGKCGYLTEPRRCSIYEARPLICRLWGAVEDLRCPHGCVPVPPARLLTPEEATVLKAEMFAIGGPPMFSALPE